MKLQHNPYDHVRVMYGLMTTAAATLTHVLVVLSCILQQPNTRLKLRPLSCGGCTRTK